MCFVRAWFQIYVHFLVISHFPPMFWASKFHLTARPSLLDGGPGWRGCDPPPTWESTKYINPCIKRLQIPDTPSQIPNSQFNTQSEKSNHVEEAVWEMLRLPHPPAAAPTSAGNQGVQNWFPSHNLPYFTPKLERILGWTVAVKWLEMLSKRGEKYFDEIKYCPWFPQLGNRAWQAARFWLCRCRRPSSFPLRPPLCPPVPPLGSAALPPVPPLSPPPPPMQPLLQSSAGARADNISGPAPTNIGSFFLISYPSDLSVLILKNSGESFILENTQFQFHTIFLPLTRKVEQWSSMDWLWKRFLTWNPLVPLFYIVCYMPTMVSSRGNLQEYLHDPVSPFCKNVKTIWDGWDGCGGWRLWNWGAVPLSQLSISTRSQDRFTFVWLCHAD